MRALPLAVLVPPTSALGADGPCLEQVAMKLTGKQSVKVEKGFALTKNLFEVRGARDGKSDCACRSTNIAPRFSEDSSQFSRTLGSRMRKLPRWVRSPERNRVR